MRGTNKRITTMIVKIGLMTAISIIMSIPPLGSIYIPAFNVHVTMAHLPTVVIALLEGPLYGAICGLFLGIISMVRCLTEPIGLNVFIWNPLCSVLPRILIGVVAGYCSMGFKLTFKNIKKTGLSDVFSLGVSAALASLTNTVGVLGMVFIVYRKQLTTMLVENDILQAAGAFLVSIAVVAGLLEMAIIAVLSVVIVKAVRRAGYR